MYTYTLLMMLNLFINNLLFRQFKMLSLKKDKKEEEDRDGGNPYSNLEKTSVLQEARYLHY